MNYVTAGEDSTLVSYGTISVVSCVCVLEIVFI